MATRGRKPKPTARKKREGNPGKRALPKSEPRPSLPVRAEPPEHLDAVGKAEWQRLYAELESLGLLTTWDAAAFGAYCEAFSLWIKAQKRLKKEGWVVRNRLTGSVKANPWVAILHKSRTEMLKAGALLGLNPSDRSRLEVLPRAPGGESEADKHFGYGAG